MLRVTGVVTGIEAGIARIECSPQGQPACAACAAGRGCGWQRPNRPRHIEIDTLRGEATALAPGDTLALEVEEGRLLRAAGRLYLPPLAGVLIGPAVCRLLGIEYGLWPLLGAGAGLTLGMVVAWRWAQADVPLRWQRLVGQSTP
jgi:positive regulator of sigma E activity